MIRSPEKKLLELRLVPGDLTRDTITSFDIDTRPRDRSLTLVDKQTNK